MDFKVAGLNPASFAETLDFQKSSAEVAPISRKISAHYGTALSGS